jgi:hypothetical protein
MRKFLIIAGMAIAIPVLSYSIFLSRNPGYKFMATLAHLWPADVSAQHGTLPFQKITAYNRYQSSAGAAQALLVPGLSHYGLEHPALVRFAAALRGQGMDVITLEMADFKKYQITDAAPDLGLAIAHLQKEGVLSEKFSLFAFCQGVPPVLDHLAKTGFKPTFVFIYDGFADAQELIHQYAKQEDAIDPSARLIARYNSNIAEKERVEILKYLLLMPPGSEGGRYVLNHVPKKYWANIKRAEFSGAKWMAWQAPTLRGQKIFMLQTDAPAKEIIIPVESGIALKQQLEKQNQVDFLLAGTQGEAGAVKNMQKIGVFFEGIVGH